MVLKNIIQKWANLKLKKKNFLYYFFEIFEFKKKNSYAIKLVFCFSVLLKNQV